MQLFVFLHGWAFSRLAFYMAGILCSWDLQGWNVTQLVFDNS